MFLFDGKFTLEQLLAVICGIILVLLLVILLKKFILKLIMSCIIVGVCMFILVNKNPHILNGVSDRLKTEGTEAFKSVISNVDNDYIKVSDKDIELRVDDDTWVSLSDIKSYVKVGKDKLSIVTKGSDSKEYVIDNESVIKFLEEISN